jgi:hypothetical protein
MTSMQARIACFAVAAVCGGAGASSASAAGGPIWITKSGGVLKEGQEKTIKMTNEGTMSFAKGTTVVNCSALESENGSIIGGNPAEGKITLRYKSCTLQGAPACNITGKKPLAAGNEGELKIPVKSILVYPNGMSGTKELALEGFFPVGEAGAVNLFVEWEYVGATCGALNGTRLAVNAVGTEVKEPAFDKKCGDLAELGKLEGANRFKLKAGEQRKEVLLGFTGPIEKGELFEPKELKFKKIECKFEAGGVQVVPSGNMKSETTPTVEEFGWEV